MLNLDLVRLSREGNQRIEAEVPADDPLWGGTELRFDGPVRVNLTATEAGSGEIILRGRVQGRVLRECRRCVEAVESVVDQDMLLVFAEVSEDRPADDDGDVRMFEADVNDIDLGEALREELVLSVGAFVVCKEDCKGLCPLCGVNLNNTSCDCSREEPDPRWDALRALKTD